MVDVFKPKMVKKADTVEWTRQKIDMILSILFDAHNLGGRIHAGCDVTYFWIKPLTFDFFHFSV